MDFLEKDKNRGSTEQRAVKDILVCYPREDQYQLMQLPVELP